MAVIADLELAVRLPGELATAPTVVRPGRPPEPVDLRRGRRRTCRVRLADVGLYTVVVLR